jgi:hypothetical protein
MSWAWITGELSTRDVTEIGSRRGNIGYTPQPVTFPVSREQQIARPLNQSHIYTSLDATEYLVNSSRSMHYSGSLEEFNLIVRDRARLIERDIYQTFFAFSSRSNEDYIKNLQDID